MRTVAVIDYGMGNLRSVAQAVMAAAHDSHIRVVITANPDEVHAAERVVLPGQGAMRDCMQELQDSGLMPAVLDAAANKPLSFNSCMQSRMAPWPGSTTRSAACTSSGLAVMTTLTSEPWAAAMTACATERKLPMP